MVDQYLGVVKRFSDFSGRASRKEFWMFFLVNLVIAIVLSIITNILGFLGILYTLFSIYWSLITIAVGIRRMHDTNRSGWWILFPIYDIVLAAMAGTKGANNYGAEPTA